MNRWGLLIPLIAILSGGCAKEVVFQEDVQTPSGIWERGWDPIFAFDIADTITPHDVYLDVRHTGDYPFSNLYTFVKLTGPSGESITDTVECTLADPSGRWFGKGLGFISSDRFQAHVLYKLRNRFPRKGRYTLMLEQAMRTQKLQGVIDVGVSVERSKSRS